jgi:hypothetical protein
MLNPGQLITKPIALEYDILFTVKAHRTIRPVERIVIVILDQFIIQLVDFFKETCIVNILATVL